MSEDKTSAPVIAIDGPSGSGKSTVSKTLATALDAGYLDTGAMYRAATHAVLQAEVDPDDADEVLKTVTTATIEIATSPEQPSVTVDGDEADEAIRSDETTANVSAVAAHGDVRKHLIKQQQELIKAAAGGIVVEGRDIAEVVAPDADLKIYLTANPDERARRRAAETGNDADSTKDSIDKRDQADSKTTRPLEAPDDSHVIDSTDLPIVEVVAKILALLNNRNIDG
ncbi:(d)CMP kinase [Haloglycomyces albus]|uniref:(d)CMP kinase n=1 Tax=Haloglycomyces albus TaxID=526067 RepID=UPI0004B2DC39|nr:(d)CMP kinase [Haloglycomyces albus]